MSRLHERQVRFRDALLGGPVAPALATIAADGLSAAGRLAIYRHHVVTTLSDALRATYPVVRRLVGDGFFGYLRDTFDVLYAEGDRAPKMMSVGLHCRLIGRPGRAAALIRFLDHLARHDRVWVATRLDIAEHWHREHKGLAANAPTVA